MASGFETARVPTANPVDEYLSQDPYGTTPFEQPMGPPGPLAFGPQMAGNLAAPYMYPQQGMMAQGPQMGQQGPQGMQGPPAPQVFKPRKAACNRTARKIWAPRCSRLCRALHK
jgi:hypothetical protein